MGDREVGGDPGRFRQEIRERLLAAGAVAVGFAEADRVDPGAERAFRRWLDAGRNAGMAYMANHLEIRFDPRLLLEGARTLVCMAFPYRAAVSRDPRLPRVSAYALLEDYHDWTRRAIRGSGVGRLLGEEGSDWRICVDSAPVMERYWAAKSGIAFRGANGAAIIPDYGPEVILAEIATKTALEADSPSARDCDDCGLCRRACPTGALRSDGTIDCRRCLSYLTIEHRGAWAGEGAEAMATAAGHATLFGCDRCVEACPLARKARAGRGVPPKARVLEGIAGLTAGDILSGPDMALAAKLRGSALKRAGRAGLARNAANTLVGDPDGDI